MNVILLGQIVDGSRKTGSDEQDGRYGKTRETAPIPRMALSPAQDRMIRDLTGEHGYWVTRANKMLDMRNWQLKNLVDERGYFTGQPRIWLDFDITKAGNLVLQW